LALASRFVGRTEEIRVLEGAIEDAKAVARVVLLTGEAGIGKTALAFEVAQRAQDAQIATARAWEAPGAPPFWLWSECLRELGEDLPPLTTSVSDESRFAALTTIVECVRRAARKRRTVLVLDDLQWADVPSLQALKLLVRTARVDRLCIVATVREPHEPSPELADVRREALVLALGGLERDAISELAHAHGIDEERAVDALTGATGGNALFALELLGDRTARAALVAGDAVEAPRGVRDLLSRHLARLAPSHRDVVSWAAVGGSPIDAGAIAAASDLPFVSEAIDAACREHVLTRAGGTLRFSHDLLRSAAYAEIPHATRAHMHEAFARVLDAHGVRRVSHLFASGSPDAPHVALDAAVHALRRFAYEDAARLATQAIAVFEGSGKRTELALALALSAEATLLRGDPERSAGEAMRALDVARESGDAVAFARAALALGLRRVVAMPSRPVAAALDEALAKLDAAGNDEVALRCAVEARLASALQPALDPVRAIATARRAVERARREHDPELLARTIHGARPAFRMLEPLEERAGMDRELRHLAERLGDRPLAAHANARVFWTALEAGHALEADLALRSLEETAAALGMPNHLLAAGLARCTWDTILGRFAPAKSVLAELESRREPWPSAWPVDPFTILRLNLFAAGGGPRPETFTGAPPPLHALMEASVVAREGRLAEAAAALSGIASALMQGDQIGFNIFVLVGDIAARVGSKPHAERCYELALPFEGRHVVLAPLPGYDGAVDRLLGALANVRGDRAAALRHYDRAIALEEQLGAAPFAARSRAERARLAPSVVTVDLRARPTLIREGETWLSTFGDESTRLKDADGLRYLAYLLARPNVPVPVVELFGERAGARGEPAPATGDAGDALDRDAIASYRERARDLRELLAEAEARNDRGAVERARTELAFLEEELSRSVGLGGRPRRAGSDQEKIRINVTTRIRKTIDKLRADAPQLAKHLDRSVKTGNLCSYEPVTS
jgi:tetratricopeptide (TPR) repeat protein